MSKGFATAPKSQWGNGVTSSSENQDKLAGLNQGTPSAPPPAGSQEFTPEWGIQPNQVPAPHSSSEMPGLGVPVGNDAFVANSAAPAPFASAMPQPPPVGPATGAASSTSGFSIAAIILGAIAFLFLPILFGPAGLILGAIAMTRKEKLALVALVVSGCGLVIGMILGAIVWSSF